MRRTHPFTPNVRRYHGLFHRFIFFFSVLCAIRPNSLSVIIFLDFVETRTPIDQTAMGFLRHLFQRLSTRKELADLQAQAECSELKTSIGLVELIGIGIGAIIGTGIFVLTGLAAANSAGPSCCAVICGGRHCCSICRVIICGIGFYDPHCRICLYLYLCDNG